MTEQKKDMDPQIEYVGIESSEKDFDKHLDQIKINVSNDLDSAVTTTEEINKIVWHIMAFKSVKGS